MSLADSLRIFLPTNRNADSEAAQSSLETDRSLAPTYTSNVTDNANNLNDRMRTLPGSDSVTLPDEILVEYSLRTTKDTPASESEVVAATPSPRYSKRPSGQFKFPLTSHFCEFVSILPDLC